MKKFVTVTIPGKFTSIRCRQCNRTETFCGGENLDTRIENFKADHAHQPAPGFNQDRFVNQIIGKFGE